jgi:hypothetical protein
LRKGNKGFFHALHYSFVSVLPTHFCHETGTFACSPSTVLPEGGFSLLLPFCIQLSHAGNLTGLGHRIKQMTGTRQIQQERILAGFPLALCMPDSQISFGMATHHEKCRLNHRKMMLLAGADMLRTMMQTTNCVKSCRLSAVEIVWSLPNQAFVMVINATLLFFTCPVHKIARYCFFSLRTSHVTGLVRRNLPCRL